MLTSMMRSGATVGALVIASLAGCTSLSTPRSSGPLAKLTARQLCAIAVGPGEQLVSWRTSTTGHAQRDLRVAAQATQPPWSDSPATARAAVCNRHGQSGTILYAVNVYGVSIAAHLGIVLLHG